jgi:hypothetical protein
VEIRQRDPRDQTPKNTTLAFTQDDDKLKFIGHFLRGLIVSGQPCKLPEFNFLLTFKDTTLTFTQDDDKPKLIGTPLRANNM